MALADALHPAGGHEEAVKDDFNVVMPRSGSVRFFRKFCEPRTGPQVQFTSFLGP